MFDLNGTVRFSLAPEVVLGDLDGDGFSEFTATGYGGLTLATDTDVWSGKDASLLAVFPNIIDGTGGVRPLKVVGDVDGDSYNDYLVNLYPTNPAGNVAIYSGKTHTILRSFQIESTPILVDRDVNGDGLTDFIGTSSVNGKVVVSRYLTLGTQPYASSTFSESTFFHSITPVGDVDGDQIPDFLFSRYITPPSEAGRLIDLLSGNDLRSLASYRLRGDTASVVIKDVNQDSVLDFFIRDSNGVMTFYSGKNLSKLYELPPPVPPLVVGRLAKPLEDLNSDGIPDFVRLVYGPTGENHYTSFLEVLSGKDGAVIQAIAIGEVGETGYYSSRIPDVSFGLVGNRAAIARTALDPLVTLDLINGATPVPTPTATPTSTPTATASPVPVEASPRIVSFGIRPQQFHQGDTVRIVATVNDDVQRGLKVTFSLNRHTPLAMTKRGKTYEAIFQVPLGNSVDLQIHARDADGHRVSSRIKRFRTL